MADVPEPGAAAVPAAPPAPDAERPATLDENAAGAFADDAAGDDASFAGIP